ncbi:MAG: hypothetical protein AAB261_05370, partial [Chloroflexota bacterium]
MPAITKKGWWAILLLGITLLFAMALGTFATGPLLGPFVGIIITALLAIATKFAKPFDRRIDEFIRENFREASSEYRI